MKKNTMNEFANIAHLVPSLVRAHDRALRAHEKVLSRIRSLGGGEAAGQNLRDRHDYTYRRMMALSGRCQGVQQGLGVPA